MRRRVAPLAALGSAALTCAMLLLASPCLAKGGGPKAKPAAASAAAKPSEAKPSEAKPGDAKPSEAKPAPLRQDPLLGRLLAALDKALAAKPEAAGEDLASAVLVGMARTSLVATLHGHFALAGLGHALRGGGMKPDEVATMAATMAQNYKGIAETFVHLAAQKAFEGELAQLWREVAAIAQKGQAAAEALQQVALHPSDAAYLAPFDAALEAYRAALQALMTALQAGQK